MKLPSLFVLFSLSLSPLFLPSQVLAQTPIRFTNPSSQPQIDVAALNQFLADPTTRDEVISDMLSSDFPNVAGMSPENKKQIRDTVLNVTLRTLDSEIQQQIYQKAFRKAVMNLDSKTAEELLTAGARGNHELNRKFICSTMVWVATNRGDLSLSEIEFKAKAKETNPESEKQTEPYARTLLPMFAKDPSLAKELCPVGDLNGTSVQLRDLMKLASPKIAKNLPSQVTTDTTSAAILADSISGCSEPEARFLIQRSMYSIETAKAGTRVQMDEAYGQCHIKGTLLKRTKETFVFVAGYDLKNSPKSSYFRDANEAVKLVMPFQKKGKVAESTATPTSTQTSTNAISNEPQQTYVSPFGTTK